MKKKFFMLLLVALATIAFSGGIELSLSEGSWVTNPTESRETKYFVRYEITPEIEEIGSQNGIDILHLCVFFPDIKADGMGFIKLTPVINTAPTLFLPSWQSVSEYEVDSQAIFCHFYDDDSELCLDILRFASDVRNGNLKGFSISLEGAELVGDVSMRCDLIMKYIQRSNRD